MGEQKKSKKVVRAGYRLRYGGDPAVDRNGVSTENHMQLYHRLVEMGPTLHGKPGPRKPRKSS